MTIVYFLVALLAALAAFGLWYRYRDTFGLDAAPTGEAAGLPGPSADPYGPGPGAGAPKPSFGARPEASAPGSPAPSFPSPGFPSPGSSSPGFPSPGFPAPGVDSPELRAPEPRVPAPEAPVSGLLGAEALSAGVNTPGVSETRPSTPSLANSDGFGVPGPFARDSGPVTDPVDDGLRAAWAAERYFTFHAIDNASLRRRFTRSGMAVPGTARAVAHGSYFGSDTYVFDLGYERTIVAMERGGASDVKIDLRRHDLAIPGEADLDVLGALGDRVMFGTDLDAARRVCDRRMVALATEAPAYLEILWNESVWVFASLPRTDEATELDEALEVVRTFGDLLRVLPPALAPDTQPGESNIGGILSGGAPSGQAREFGAADE